MGIYEVIVSQRYFNQTVLNRYHYVSSGTPAAVQPSYGLLYAMGYITSRLAGGAFPNGTLARTIQVIQSATTSYISAYARNLYSVTDFYENPWPTPPVGTQADEGLSPASAFAFSCSRVRTDIRRGFKRFVGVDELLLDPLGVITDPGLALMDDVAEEMSQPVTSEESIYTPCVISRQRVVDPETDKVTYELYATEETQIEHIASPLEWAPYPTVRSQTSRQYNRGS